MYTKKYTAMQKNCALFTLLFSACNAHGGKIILRVVDSSMPTEHAPKIGNSRQTTNMVLNLEQNPDMVDEHAENISEIRCVENILSEEVCIFLRLASKSRFSLLSDLMFNEVALGTKGAKLLSQLNAPVLNALHVSHCELDDISMSHLGKASFKTLARLFFIDNHVSFFGIKALVHANFPKIRELRLDNNTGIGETSMDLIITAQWNKGSYFFEDLYVLFPGDLISASRTALILNDKIRSKFDSEYCAGNLSYIINREILRGERDDLKYVKMLEERFGVRY